MRIRFAVALAPLVVAAAFVAPAARADAAQDAEAAYQQGMDLLRDKKIDQACAALDRSEHLEARGGTLLSLAYCHEQQARFSLAYSEYDEALRRLRVGGGRPDREQFATKQMESIRDKVVFVNVDLEATMSAPNREIVITPAKSGDVERKVALGDARSKQIALDPDGGAYRVEVRAVDRKPFVAQVQVAGRTPAPASIVVTALAPEGAGAAVSPVPRAPEEDGSGQRTTGLVVGGIGAALAIGGGVFGVLAMKCTDDYNKDGSCSRDTAKVVYANVANAGIGLGVVGLAVGGYLFFSAPKGEKASVGVAPSVGPGSAGLSLGGRF